MPDRPDSALTRHRDFGMTWWVFGTIGRQSRNCMPDGTRAGRRQGRKGNSAMERRYLKRATRTSRSDAGSVHATVKSILEEIETGRDVAAQAFAKKFDGTSGPFELTAVEIAGATASVPPRLQDDLAFAHDNIRRFAEAQRDSLGEFEIEVRPGFVAGQRCIPVETVGCYAPGGRYSHVASAMMTVTTARAAGCGTVVLCSPPGENGRIDPAIVHVASLCGADRVLAIGGVQAVAAMAFGLFGLPASDVIAGPGNQFVAEAKRILFGRVGIDMLAGPTDSLVIADSSADPDIVAADLVGQAEHGYNSPVWLVTNDPELAETVLKRVPHRIAALPDRNRESAEAAWRDFAEVILCDSREDMAATADEYAPEHLTVLADDLDWWLGRLKSYGSLFLGEETTVAFGDKASGPNHVLPTSGAARYTGGLSVHKFLKVVTWQRSTVDGSRPIAEATARISRLEGMEGHARTADIRLQKFFPNQSFDLVGDAS